MRACKLIVYSVLIVMAVLAMNHSVLGNGGEFKQTEYLGEIQTGDDSGKVQFSTTIDRLMFTLTSLRNKYKVIRIQIENSSKSPISLSIEKDEMEIFFEDGKKINGILNIRKHDPELWSGFRLEIREMLAYPEVVTAPPNRGVHNVFVFIPDPRLDVLPVIFRYKIDSLERKPVEIKMPLRTGH